MSTSPSLTSFKYFPYTPYPPQYLFMSSLYKTLQDPNFKFSLFESPTGTGKTLMLLSTLFQYLDSLNTPSPPPSPPSSLDWLSSFTNQPKPKPKPTNPSPPLLFNSTHLSFPKKDKLLISDISDTSSHLSLPPPKQNQIFFCTRTHSQITQIITEIKKIQTHLSTTHHLPFPYTVSFLASRKHLCLNKNVNKSNVSLTYINSKCKELNEEKSTQCKYHCNMYNETLMNKETTTQIYDIEELAKMCERLQCCPYYLSKRNVNTSDIVLMPYNHIINRTIRNRSNINIKGSVIVFDEAHNIVESVLNACNCECNEIGVCSFVIGLCLYYDKYSVKLKASNNLNIRQLIKIGNEMYKWLMNHKSNNNNGNTHSVTVSISDFIMETNLIGYDLFKLVKFVDEVELHDKIKWTYEKHIKTPNDSVNIELICKQHSLSLNAKDIVISNLYKTYISNDICNKISLFLKGLTNTDDNAILILTSQSSQSSQSSQLTLKFQMINPIKEFEYLVTNAKAIVFAGGTLQPFDDFYNLLSSSSSSSAISTFIGTHIIPPTSIHTYTLAGNIFANNEPFTLTYDTTLHKKPLLYSSILQYIKAYYTMTQDISACGIAVFVCSYDMLEQLITFNKQEKILNMDNVFYETHTSNEDVFGNYSKNILVNKRSSVIIAVIGGKLSEGINFSDSLARVLIIFGVPFSNVKAVELQEKMKFYDKLFEQKKSNMKGRDYYENICMKNVNQTIGRCIRHYKDYAVVVLGDRRYCYHASVKGKLPKWIGNEKGNVVCNKKEFDEHIEKVKKFLGDMEKGGGKDDKGENVVREG